MSTQDQRKKSQAMAAHMLKLGIYHGKRLGKPYPNSGGTTGINLPGSSKNHRRLKTR